MATESSLTHDGGNTTAAADLSGSQFKLVVISAGRNVNLASSGSQPAYGVLQNKPTTGQAADVGILGISKCLASGVITAGSELVSDSVGRLAVAAVGSSGFSVGVALEAAAAANTIFTAFIRPNGKI